VVDLTTMIDITIITVTVIKGRETITVHYLQDLSNGSRDPEPLPVTKRLVLKRRRPIKTIKK
jgi:hypothetical protein